NERDRRGGRQRLRWSTPRRRGCGGRGLRMTGAARRVGVVPVGTAPSGGWRSDAAGRGPRAAASWIRPSGLLGLAGLGGRGLVAFGGGLLGGRLRGGLV